MVAERFWSHTTVFTSWLYHLLALLHWASYLTSMFFSFFHCRCEAIIIPDAQTLGVFMCAKSLQSCLTLCDPMDCSPPGSSVHGILQARIVEWLPCSPPGDLPDPGIKLASCASSALAGGFFTTGATWEARKLWYHTIIKNMSIIKLLNNHQVGWLFR